MSKSLKYVDDIITLYTDLIDEEFVRGSHEDKVQSPETSSNWSVKMIDNDNDYLNDCC